MHIVNTMNTNTKNNKPITKEQTKMDKANQKAMYIMKTEGTEAVVKHMFNPTGKRQLSYAEMRSMYG